MAYSDRELLARLIQCEAGGEGDTGMKAVAGVVMNRVHARGGEYARVGRGSIRNIIFQPYQFVCASETERGTYNPQNIFNMRPEQIHFDIADWAIAGNRIPDVAESLWFYNPFGPQCRSRFPSEVGYWQTRIGDHCFYNPTDAYYRTREVFLCSVSILTRQRRPRPAEATGRRRSMAADKRRQGAPVMRAPGSHRRDRSTSPCPAGR